MLHETRGLTERYPAQLLVPVMDMLTIMLAGIVAYGWRFENIQLGERYWLALAIMALLAVLLNSLMGAYARWRITPMSALLGRLFLVWLFIAAIAAALIYFAHAAERFSRLWVGMTLLLSFFMAGGGRLAAQLVLRKARLKGRARRPVFLIGSGEQLLEVARGMRASPLEGYSIAGVERLLRAPDDQELERITRRVGASGARDVWICLPVEMGSVVRPIMHALRHHTGDVRFIPDFHDIQLLNYRISEVAGHYAIDLSVTPMQGMAVCLKRLEDLVLGSLISLLILPVCLAIALVIKLDSSGPVLFKQYRTGVNGRYFKVYKFRSMRVHKEGEGKVTQATRNDPRVTRIGAFLRRTSLDELPQFYNVLQGRMSIVGPRPHALAHNDYYKDLVESYMKRHKVKPGITGWAQVNGYRGETDTHEKMEGRVAHDLWYINNWSLWLDIRIIFLTVFKGFINQNAF